MVSDPAPKVAVPTVQRTIVTNILVIKSGLAISGNITEYNQRNDADEDITELVIPDAITISSHDDDIDY